MKPILFRLVRLLAVVAVIGVVLKVTGPRISEAMERKFAEASDDFPPKWMYSNITTIRENTERILEAVANEPADTDTEAA